MDIFAELLVSINSSQKWKQLCGGDSMQYFYLLPGCVPVITRWSVTETVFSHLHHRDSGRASCNFAEGRALGPSTCKRVCHAAVVLFAHVLKAESGTVLVPSRPRMLSPRACRGPRWGVTGEPSLWEKAGLRLRPQAQPLAEGLREGAGVGAEDPVVSWDGVQPSKIYPHCSSIRVPLHLRFVLRAALCKDAPFEGL